jgi:polyisoprenoid-binding protein YceI
MSNPTAISEPASIPIDRPHPPPTGTWTIDPANSSVTLARRRLRLWTTTGRLHILGLVHLDELPPPGVIRFEQPSGRPVLTMALEPASVETGDADLAAMLGGPDVSDTLRHRWWTLRSESLQVLPTGTWRVMATLTTDGTPGLVELRLEVDPEVSSADWLVLRGRGLLDRRAFGTGSPASTLSPKIRLDLAVRARRVGSHTRTYRQGGTDAQPACRAESGSGRATHDQSARAGLPCAGAWHRPADSPAPVEGASLGMTTRGCRQPIRAGCRRQAASPSPP